MRRWIGRPWQRDPEDPNRGMGWVVLFCAVVILVFCWVTVRQMPSLTNRVDEIPELPDAQERESFPMPPGYHDRG